MKIIGYYVSDEGFQGVVTQETLESAVGDDAIDDSWSNEYFEDVPTVAPGDLIEEVIPETLDNSVPLPVVNQDGDLQGQLSRRQLAKVLTNSK